MGVPAPHGETGGRGLTHADRGLVGRGARFLGPVDGDTRATQHCVLGRLYLVGVERNDVISPGARRVGVVRSVAPARQLDAHGVVGLGAELVRQCVRVGRGRVGDLSEIGPLTDAEGGRGGKVRQRVVLREIGPGARGLYDLLVAGFQKHRIVLPVIRAVPSYVVGHIVFGAGAVGGTNVVYPLPDGVGGALVLAHVVLLTAEERGQEVGGGAGHRVSGTVRHDGGRK